ncbi:hypothetical protein [Mesorhizobium loti]|uniref:hypothetical protein n=1 Tax=Rhizobium loti TaxID=381 RepID=UPI0004123A78|nr:hypothetical protein [Mesorhizobium loti]
MAKIVVITHEHDMLYHRKLLRGTSGAYMICAVMEELQRRGHSWVVAAGSGAKLNGDAAVLHVDTTTTDRAYIEYVEKFAFCLNIGATDISKRRISEALVKSGDGWDGPVIVKTDLNHGGLPEESINRRAERSGARTPFPNVQALKEYKVFESLGHVQQAQVDDDRLVIERFLPEQTHDGYALRHWLFCGDYDFCRRFVSKERLVKGAGMFRSEPSPIPDDLRTRRRELGFDYGKFDFAIYDGKSYLLDANKTPGNIPSSGDTASIAGLADGFEGLLRTMI